MHFLAIQVAALKIAYSNLHHCDQINISVSINFYIYFILHIYVQGIPPVLCDQYPLLFPNSFSYPAAAPHSLNIQHVVEVGDVTHSQDLNLGQLLVSVRWEQFSELCESHVEGHHADPFPGGVRGSIFRCRAPPSPLFLSAERGHVHGARRALPTNSVGCHGPAPFVECVQKGLGVRLSAGQIGTEHHLSSHLRNVHTERFRNCFLKIRTNCF